MSSTRRAGDNAEPAYEKYLSAPEFAALRPIPGNVVLAKALLYKDASVRELAFFLQAMSMQPGGLRSVAESLITRHPKNSRDSGESRSAGACRLAAMLVDLKEEQGAERKRRRLLAEADVVELSDYLVELAINPRADLSADDCNCFVKLGTCLTEYKREWETAMARAHVLTSGGKIIADSLDQALRMRRMVVIEGNAGAGKSTNAKHWCAQRPGLVRYVTLSGLTNRTTFFQKIASAIGLATCQRKAVELQVKIEEFFARSRMMLVLDEAHYCWPQTLRVESAPELIDWIDTALVNQGVPVALLCTDQFAKLKNRVERRTGWTSNQFIHRVYRYRKLSAPTREDVEAVTRSLLSAVWNRSAERWEPGMKGLGENAEQGLVSYAMGQETPFACVSDCVQEARKFASQAGRLTISIADLQKAFCNGQVPSDTALARAFAPAEKKGRASRTQSPPSPRGKAYVDITAARRGVGDKRRRRG